MIAFFGWSPVTDLSATLERLEEQARKAFARRMRERVKAAFGGAPRDGSSGAGDAS